MSTPRLNILQEQGTVCLRRLARWGRAQRASAAACSPDPGIICIRRTCSRRRPRHGTPTALEEGRREDGTLVLAFRDVWLPARDQFTAAFLQGDGFRKTKALLRHADPPFRLQGLNEDLPFPVGSRLAPMVEARGGHTAETPRPWNSFPKDWRTRSSRRSRGFGAPRQNPPTACYQEARGDEPAPGPCISAVSRALPGCHSLQRRSRDCQ